MSNQIMTAAGQMYSKKVSLLSQQGWPRGATARDAAGRLHMDGAASTRAKHSVQSHQVRRDAALRVLRSLA